MLYYLSLELRSNIASFRNPDFQNFHKSFILPPPTTLIGLAGAALGFNPLESQNFFDDHCIYAGVSGGFKGKSTDLWKYRDAQGRSIIRRELLFFNHYSVVYASESEEIAKKIEDAFINPVYALSLGPSDSLVHVKKEIRTGYADFLYHAPSDHSLVSGDVTVEAFQKVLEYESFKFRIDHRDAVVANLPVRFQYEAAFGMRRIKERKVFSFVQDATGLSGVKRKGVLIDGTFVHLFQL